MDEDVGRWFAKAAQDLDDGEYLLEDGRFEAASFHAQQAAEKALKGALIHRDGSFPKIHDLAKLAGQLGADQDLMDRAAHLSQVYVSTRYPDVENPINRERAEDFMGFAKEVVAWARERSS